MFLYILLFAVPIITGLLYAWYRVAQKTTHAGGIVYKIEKGRALFLIVTSASNKNRWVLPKGRIEKGETPEHAAVREVMEEAGVAAKAVKKAGTIKYTEAKRMVVVYFLMKFEAFHGTSTENRKTAWVEKEEAMKKLGRSRLKKMLKRLRVG